jgi:uncharacterized membrane protein HdeD (DUF308 family)
MAFARREFAGSAGKAPARRFRAVTILAGILLAGVGIAISARPIADPAHAVAFSGLMLLVGGIAEFAIGLAGLIIVRQWQELALATLSIVTAIWLILTPPGSALSLASLLAVWLWGRAISELLAGVVAARHHSRASMARLIKSLVDLALGIAATIGALTTALWPSWPTATVQEIVRIAAISLAATGVFHIGLAAADAMRAPRRPG